MAITNQRKQGEQTYVLITSAIIPPEEKAEGSTHNQLVSYSVYDNRRRGGRGNNRIRTTLPIMRSKFPPSSGLANGLYSTTVRYDGMNKMVPMRNIAKCEKRPRGGLVVVAI